MKEIVLSVKRQKTEIKIFCVCIALAYLKKRRKNLKLYTGNGMSWQLIWNKKAHTLWNTSECVFIFFVQNFLEIRIIPEPKKMILLFSWKKSG